MGSDREREMVNFLEDHGWGAVRLGGSGSGTKRNLPDILAGDGGSRYWGIEEKYSGSNKQCYITAEKATGLREFCTRFGLRPLAAVRYSTRLDGVEDADWYVAPLSELPITGSGSVKLHHSVVEGQFPLLEEIV